MSKTQVYLSLPVNKDPQSKRFSPPKTTDLITLVTISDEEKYEYHVSDFEAFPLPDTRIEEMDLSYTSLFVNGVIQPNTHYQFKNGTLTFLTEDTPEKNVPIILQLVKIQ
ncbi:DUF4183 domain-containing protein [Gracilibacillus sp. YIM 98692]|uniref:DUF4183 domain-containing protein n=1 Tax=Gracilibacillus sp. YIM 98692 TaxID=2663532 RepID=UPI0013D3349F|nr:DUF4183 domain-containing protein [Gracilibacillus sp. YIM 98692]